MQHFLYFVGVEISNNDVSDPTVVMLRARILELEDRCASYEMNYASLEKRISEMNNSIISSDVRLKSLETNHANLTDAMSCAKGYIESVSQKMNDCVATTNQLSAANDARSQQLNAQMKQIRDDAAVHQQSTSKMSEQITACQHSFQNAATESFVLEKVHVVQDIVDGLHKNDMRTRNILNFPISSTLITRDRAARFLINTNKSGDRRWPAHRNRFLKVDILERDAIAHSLFSQPFSEWIVQFTKDSKLLITWFSIEELTLDRPTWMITAICTVAEERDNDKWPFSRFVQYYNCSSWSTTNAINPDEQQHIHNALFVVETLDKCCVEASNALNDAIATHRNGTAVIDQIFSDAFDPIFVGHLEQDANGHAVHHDPVIQLSAASLPPLHRILIITAFRYLVYSFFNAPNRYVSENQPITVRRCAQYVEHLRCVDKRQEYWTHMILHGECGATRVVSLLAFPSHSSHIPVLQYEIGKLVAATEQIAEDVKQFQTNDLHTNVLLQRRQETIHGNTFNVVLPLPSPDIKRLKGVMNKFHPNSQTPHPTCAQMTEQQRIERFTSLTEALEKIATGTKAFHALATIEPNLQQFISNNNDNNA